MFLKIDGFIQGYPENTRISLAPEFSSLDAKIDFINGGVQLINPVSGRSLKKL